MDQTMDDESPTTILFTFVLFLHHPSSATSIALSHVQQLSRLARFFLQLICTFPPVIVISYPTYTIGCICDFYQYKYQNISSKSFQIDKPTKIFWINCNLGVLKFLSILK